MTPQCNPSQNKISRRGTQNRPGGSQKAPGTPRRTQRHLEAARTPLRVSGSFWVSPGCLLGTSWLAASSTLVSPEASEWHNICNLQPWMLNSKLKCWNVKNSNDEMLRSCIVREMLKCWNCRKVQMLEMWKYWNIEILKWWKVEMLKCWRCWYLHTCMWT